jgi:F-type H+-transporting ATPase subunit delta
VAESITLARPYAEAAFKLAREANSLELWSQSLAVLESIIADERIASRLGDPNVAAADLENLVLGVLGEQLDGFGRNFVQVLIANDRLGLVHDIRGIFEKLKLEHEGVLEAQIESAFAIDDAQTAELVRKLESRHKRKVRAQVSVKPELIGGVRIIVGDKVFDATVRGHLDAMSTALSR